jgi:hypothetical protein
MPNGPDGAPRASRNSAPRNVSTLAPCCNAIDATTAKSRAIVSAVESHLAFDRNYTPDKAARPRDTVAAHRVQHAPPPLDHDRTIGVVTGSRPIARMRRRLPTYFRPNWSTPGSSFWLAR